MATQTRRIAADVESVWRLVSDPWEMPRWWPGVVRMEGVDEERFTQVFVSQRGRTVRADFTVLESLGPGAAGVGLARRLWSQETAGTPFERVLAEAVTEILLEGQPGSGETVVTLAQDQQLRGYSRTGGLLVRRATARKLGEALAGLAVAADPDAPSGEVAAGDGGGE